MGGAFNSCKNLKYIDLRNFNTDGLILLNRIFMDIPDEGRIIYNSKILMKNIFRDTNIEKWEQADLAYIIDDH